MTPNEDDHEQIGERVRIYRRGRRWYANFQLDGKQHRVSLETTNKKEARRRALKIETELAVGRWKPAPSAISVDAAIDAYMNSYKSEERAETTITKYDTILARVKLLARDLKIRELSGINLRLIDAYRKLRKDAGKAVKTIYVEVVLIRQLINFAMTREMLASDPLKGLKIKKPKPTTQPCWTREKVDLILANSPAEIRPALTLLAELGVRFGELAWCTWEDVEGDVLHIQPKPGWKPKSGDRRTIPLTPLAQATLAALPRTYRWIVTMPPTKQRPEKGRQWEEKRLLTALKTILKKLGLVGKLHTFRHSFISNALLSGIPVAVVQKWAGHVDEQILKLYTHVNDGASQEAMRKLAEANAAVARAKNAEITRGCDSAQSQHSQEAS